MKRRVLILLGCSIAAVVLLVLVPSAMQPTIVWRGAAQPTERTTGVVKSLKGPTFLSASKLQRAAVTLSDGSEVEATVLPGCIVHLGDKVHVHVFAGGSGPNVYVVAGET